MQREYDPYNQSVQRQAVGVAPRDEQRPMMQQQRPGGLFPQQRMGGFGGHPQNGGINPGGMYNQMPKQPGGVGPWGSMNRPPQQIPQQGMPQHFGMPQQNGGINPNGMYTQQQPMLPKQFGGGGPYDPYGQPGQITGSQPMPGFGQHGNGGINPGGMYTNPMPQRHPMSEGMPVYPMGGNPGGGIGTMPANSDLFSPPPQRDGNPGEEMVARKNPYMQSYLQSF